MNENKKYCSSCKQNKDSNLFTASELKRSYTRCKECVNIYNHNYNKNNKEKMAIKSKEYRDAHKEKLAEYNKLYRKKHREELIEYSAKWNAEHREESLEYAKARYDANKEEINAAKRELYKENGKEINEKNKARRRKRKETDPDFAEKELEKHRQYRIDNYDKYIENKREYEQNKRNNDPAFNCRHAIRALINYVIKSQGGKKAGQSAWKYMPYESPLMFVKHIESQWSLPENLDYDGKVWMTWNNRGLYDPKTWDDNDSSTWTWQIDHIIPQSDLSYDSMEHPNFKLAWAPENIRPLRADINNDDGVNRKRHKTPRKNAKKK